MIKLNTFHLERNNMNSTQIKQKRISNDLGQSILKNLVQDQNIYEYENLTRLQFEMKLRKRIVESATLLNQSGVTYAVFEESFCNAAYWDLQSNGGFKLKPNIQPSTAIQDIYINGSKYAFECATAMVIVFYRAVLQVIEESHFNRLFTDILLWDWHYDQDLGITTIETNDYIFGDVLYFDNPDVNPQSIEWQGENVVYLERDTYYGHGIGIKSAQEMINALNAHRKPGSNRSAYLLDQSTRPGFQYLSQFEARPSHAEALNRDLHEKLLSFCVATIGSHTHIHA